MMKEAVVSSLQCQLSWASIRACYWRADRDDRLTVGSPSNLVPPPPLLGIMCTMFAVGVTGRDWLRRMMASSWFMGLQPRPEDLRAGKRSKGHWVTPSGGAARDLDAAIQLLLAEGRPPRAPVASIAVMNGADEAERSVAAALARALAEWSMPSRKAPRVVSTLGKEIAADVEFIDRLRKAGAAVVIGDASVPEDRLHHFPARAVTIPRTGQWVGVDTADHLEIVVPGALARLHSIPSEFERAIAALGALRPAWPVRGLILNFQVGDESPLQLREIDELATHCRDVVFPETERILFTTREGTEGLVEVLLVAGVS